MTFLTWSEFRKDTISEMKLTVLDIIGDNSGEHAVMCLSARRGCQGELHRIALILNAQSLFSGSLHISVGHLSRRGWLLQTISPKRGRGWSENVSKGGGCLMVFPGQHWVFLDTSKTALTRSQCWFPCPAERVSGGLGCTWGSVARGFPVLSKYEGSSVGWIH